MTWLISHALMKAYENSRSLQGLEVESLAATCLDGEPSAQSNGSPTQQAYLSPDKTTAFSRLSRFGMTFKPLTENLGKDVSMWFQEVSRAKTSVSPERESGLTEPDQACGPTWRASLAKFDLVTSSWKTAQLSLLGDLESSSVTWPRSGMTVDGQCWELPMLGRRISATESGFVPNGETFFHTPNTNGLDGGSNSRKALKKRQWPTPQTRGFTNDGDLMALANMCENYEEMSRMAYRAADKKKRQYWPTPTSIDAGSGRFNTSIGGKPRPTLALMARKNLWPTPTVSGNYNRKGASKTAGDGLATAVRRWPTPTAHMAKDTNAPSESLRNQPTLTSLVGGKLNPAWVEWLMGWPLDHTDLKPLAMDKFLQWRQQHGSY